MAAQPPREKRRRSFRAESKSPTSWPGGALVLPFKPKIRIKHMAKTPHDDGYESEDPKRSNWLENLLERIDLDRFGD